MMGKTYMRLRHRAAGLISLVGALLMSAASLAAQDLPDGPGKAEVEANCSTCHNLNRVVNRTDSPEGWLDMVHRMVGYGAVFTNEDIQLMATYLGGAFPDRGPAQPKNAAMPVPADNVKIDIKEWKVPYDNTRPRDPYVAPDGTVYFVGQTGDYVGHLNPATGEFKKWDLGKGVGPHTQIVDQEGMVWFAGNRVGYIGKLNPTNGEITRYNMPSPEAKDPHTLAFDGKGNIFFTAQQSNYVGKLEMGNGKVTLAKLRIENARPYGILVDTDGFPWFNQFGTNYIGRMEPGSLEIKSYKLPNEKARDRRIARTPDGLIWYSDYARGYLGRVDPESGNVKEWALPGGSGSNPYALTVDDKGNVWTVESGHQPNRFIGFDPKREKMFSITEVPSGGGTVRHMVFDPKTRAIWFGTDTNHIGRALVP
jgi:virginiamycin B lyase